VQKQSVHNLDIYINAKSPTWACVLPCSCDRSASHVSNSRGCSHPMMTGLMQWCAGRHGCLSSMTIVGTESFCTDDLSATLLTCLPVYTGSASRSLSSIRSLCLRYSWECTMLFGSAQSRVIRRSLRSASTACLIMSPFKLSTIGRRTFNAAAAHTWNGLSEDVTSTPTLHIFRNTWSKGGFCHSPGNGRQNI